MPSTEPSIDRPPGFLESVSAAFGSWRVASVALLSFSSGLPLGLVWIAIPDWMRSSGVDIRIVGLFTLAQAPWTFKILWSPLMDRYVPPFWGRRRGWMAIAQIALLVLTLALAGVGHDPATPWIVLALTLAIAFASATQDIAYDAYAVDVLRKDEQGVAVGLKTATYRAAMLAAGALSITAAAYLSWPVVCVGLALLYVPMLLITRKAPEPEKSFAAPRNLREAFWLPLLGFLGRRRALEILAFVFSYKLADALSQSLLRPFLHDMGYSAVDRGAGFGIFGTWSTLVGTFLGGALVPVLGLGHCLWIFGFLQIFSNLGYILLAHSEVNRPLMYGAMGFETFTTGLGIGAFSVFLLRITQKRFSATQYALFSSLFGLPRILGGPVTGFVVHAAGWSTFFWLTIVAGIPGLVLLARFAPPGVRDPVIVPEAPKRRARLSTASLLGRGALGGLAGLVVAAGSVASLDALEALRDDPEAGFSVTRSLDSMLHPGGAADWLLLAGITVFALICGLFTAAVAAARRGSSPPNSLEET